MYRHIKESKLQKELVEEIKNHFKCQVMVEWNCIMTRLKFCNLVVAFPLELIEEVWLEDNYNKEQTFKDIIELIEGQFVQEFIRKIKEWKLI